MAATEEVDIKLPNGEMATAIVPMGSSPDQIKSLLRTKHPEFFTNAPTPSLERPGMPSVIPPELSGAGPADRGGAQGAFLLGALRGVGNTGFNLAKMLSQAGAVGADVHPVGDKPELLKPSLNPAEQLGYGAEQVGEFFLPGGAITKGAKAIEGAKVLQGLSPILRKILARGATEAAGTGAVAGAQGGDAGQAALIGGAGGAGGELLGVLAPLFAKSAQKSILKVLNPTKPLKPLAQQVAPELAARGVVAGSRTGLEEQAAKQIATIGRRIDDAVDALPKDLTGSTKPIIDTLEKAKLDFIVGGIPIEPEKIARITEVQGIIKQYGDDVSYQTLRKLRQVFDRVVAEGKGFSGKTLAEGSALEVKNEAANAIRRELAKASPDVAKLNAEYSFWKKVERVIGDTNQRATPGTPIRDFLTSAITGGGVAGAAQVAGLGGGPTVAGGLAIGAITRIMKSTAWRTVSAANKDRLARFIADGNFAGAARLAGKLGASQAQGK